MRTRTKTPAMTFDEFMVISREDRQENLLDGVMYVSSPVNMNHSELSSWLVQFIGLYIDERALGRIMFERVAFRLSETWAPEPDIAFVRTDRLRLLRPGFVDGPPDLAIEIVSPDSDQRDYEIKREGYEKFGVREYWIIDPDEETSLFLVLGKSGYEEVEPLEHIFISRALPGFRLDVRWLWQRPMPRVLPILNALLAEPRE